MLPRRADVHGPVTCWEDEGHVADGVLVVVENGALVVGTKGGDVGEVFGAGGEGLGRGVEVGSEAAGVIGGEIGGGG